MPPENEILIKEISAILLKDWDPLGVSDMPDARREYDAYAAEIFSMYEKGDISHEMVFNYLKATTEKSLDMKADDLAIGQAVGSIMELFKAEEKL
ncbi:MAG: hypothetical protein WAV15_04235 [Minisyncoccia bacterium]